MRRTNAPDLKILVKTKTHSHADVRLTDACKRAIIQRQNLGLPYATICGFVWNMCANITNLGIIMRGCRVLALKLKSDVPLLGATKLEICHWQAVKTALKTRLACLILKIVMPLTGTSSPPEERRAWKILQLSPVTDIDIVKKQYKRLVKQNHPDKNGGDAAAEERLKDINLAYSLIRKSLASSGKNSRLLV